MTAITTTSLVVDMSVVPHDIEVEIVAAIFKIAAIVITIVNKRGGVVVEAELRTYLSALDILWHLVKKDLI